MIQWISVNDKMPEAGDYWSNKQNYFVLLRNGDKPSVMAIATFYSPHEDKEPKWHPINYDNQFIYSYKNGGLPSNNDICSDDFNYYDGCTMGNCIPVDVTHWSPIEWVDPVDAT